MAPKHKQTEARPLHTTIVAQAWQRLRPAGGANLCFWSTAWGAKRGPRAKGERPIPTSTQITHTREAAGYDKPCYTPVTSTVWVQG